MQLDGIILGLNCAFMLSHARVHLLAQIFALGLGTIAHVLHLFIETSKQCELLKNVIFDAKVMALHFGNICPEIFDSFV